MSALAQAAGNLEGEMGRKHLQWGQQQRQRLIQTMGWGLKALTRPGMEDLGGLPDRENSRFEI